MHPGQCNAVLDILFVAVLVPVRTVSDCTYAIGIHRKTEQIDTDISRQFAEKSIGEIIFGSDQTVGTDPAEHHRISVFRTQFSVQNLQTSTGRWSGSAVIVNIVRIRGCFRLSRRRTGTAGQSGYDQTCQQQNRQSFFHSYSSLNCTVFLFLIM